MKTRRCPRCCGGGLTIRPIFGDGTIMAHVACKLYPIFLTAPLPCCGCGGTGRVNRQQWNKIKGK